MPCFVRSREELIDEFAQLGYEIVDQWPVLEKTLDFALLPDYIAPYAGFYLRRKGIGAVRGE